MVPFILNPLHFQVFIAVCKIDTVMVPLIFLDRDLFNTIHTLYQLFDIPSFCNVTEKNIACNSSLLLNTVFTTDNMMNYIISVLHLAIFTDTAHCKAFEVEKIHGFRGSIGNHKTFPVKQPGQQALAMQDNHPTTNVFQQITVQFCNRKTFPAQMICNIYGFDICWPCK